MYPYLLLKSHNKGYTRKDGTVVSPFDDSRVKKTESLEIIIGEPLSEEAKKELMESRQKVREVLHGLEPKEVKALKNKSPEEYKAILKSIVRKLFPKGADIQFRKEGKVFDYDHLLTDVTRHHYIHTLPETLKRHHIKVEFKNGDIPKAYFIKKYFDPDIQQDVWDMVVLHEKELRTKIARKGRKGSGYIESQILGAGNEGSRSATPTEAGIEDPLHQAGLLDKNVSQNLYDVNLKKSISLGLYLLRKSRSLHGRMDFNGLQVSIENRKGSIRQWHDPHEDRDGITRMQYPYGYIRMTEGSDGDHVDCYIGPHRDAPCVYIVHQMKAPDFKGYDEDKCMLGFLSEDDARRAYLDHYDDPRFLGSITKMPFEEFKEKVLATKGNPGKVEGSGKTVPQRKR